MSKTRTTHRGTKSAVKQTPWKRLVVLIILIVALLASLTVGTVKTDKNRFSPDFALDLIGGTQMILHAETTDGSDISDEDINQAIEIIRQRVDGSGVAEAEINAQGNNNIVVSLPGNPSEETKDLVSTSAVLRMRPVLAIAGPSPTTGESATSESTTGTIEGSDTAAQTTITPSAAADQEGTIENKSFHMETPSPSSASSEAAEP
ncbi:MAG: protein translocase subunit SecD, partial [Actinomycetaceae bacterium]|nr:protein translocase subunit SecD [Actinomycetaceae bacterium]